jgi:hypothetical protein
MSYLLCQPIICQQNGFQLKVIKPVWPACINQGMGHLRLLTINLSLNEFGCVLTQEILFNIE